jgi:hypothetical protein
VADTGDFLGADGPWDDDFLATRALAYMMAALASAAVMGTWAAEEWPTRTRSSSAITRSIATNGELLQRRSSRSHWCDAKKLGSTGIA